jgi:mono/diheme cytochrome c family protein
VRVAADAAARGRTLYERERCATCHDKTPPQPGLRPLRGLSARYTLESLVDLLHTPTPPMPVPNLTTAEREDLAAFLLSR